MSLHIKQENDKSQLQQKIASDLRAKVSQDLLISDKPDAKDADAVYLENTKQTTGLVFIWLLLFLAFLISVGYFLAFS